MTDDRKAAEAAVKTAERAHEAAAKKADAAREKYIELNAIRNVAARTLAHARTNPALFDDDPLQVVTPGDWPVRDAISTAGSGLVIEGGTFTVPTREVVIHTLSAATAPAQAPPAAAAVAAPAQVADPDEIAPVADLTGAEELPPEDGDTPPWQQPAATPAPKTRRVGQRRTAAAKEAQEQQPAPALADPNPPEVVSPPTEGAQQFTPEGFPVEIDPYSPF